MKKKVTILISARDPGAAGNIVVLSEYFRKDEQFIPFVVASASASEILDREKVEHIRFVIDDSGCDHVSETGDPLPLLRKAGALVQQLKPDIVLTSLSSFGAGIDEALLASADCPAFALQDFWGDVNLSLGTPADIYFVLDEFAAELSRKRWGINGIPTGMPKYIPFRHIDFPEVKKHVRREILKIDDSMKLIGWFGQSPDIPGHEDVFHSFVNACAALPSNYAVTIREHPKFSSLSRQHRDEARDRKLRLLSIPADPGVPTNRLLAACDLVVTPFSLCGLDHAAMSEISPEPLGSVLYLMCNDDIQGFCKRVCGMVQFPIVEKAGAGLFIESNDVHSIAAAIQKGTSDEGRQTYHANCKKIIQPFDYHCFKKILLQKTKINRKDSGGKVYVKLYPG